MSVKLLLNPAADAKECIHQSTGVKFMIRPIQPPKFSEIRKASLGNDGELDLVKWGGNFAVEAIAGWDDQIGDKNGPLECTEDNRRTFGRNQVINIMPWIIDQATSLDQYRIEEVSAAKNG